MVVRLMPISSITQCDRDLDFQPRKSWPAPFPAFAWKGQLICAFERQTGAVTDLFEAQKSGLLESLHSCHPELGLSELARLARSLSHTWPETYLELREGFFAGYGLRWSERLEQTLAALLQTPAVFQNWVDEKKISPRDLSPLLALTGLTEFNPFLTALPSIEIGRSEGVRALEIGVELFLMGRPLNDLLPTQSHGSAYLRQLEKWRRPQGAESDEQWKQDVSRWPWPSQVQAQWQRFGDTAGLEIKIRTTSPEDFHKKLERLISIGDTWNARTEQ